MRIIILSFLTIALGACGGGSKSTDISSPQVEESPATEAYAAGLVREDYDDFLVELRNLITKLRQPYLLEEVTNPEDDVSRFEQLVASGILPTQQELLDLQEMGMALSSKLETSSYLILKQSSALSEFANDLPRLFNTIENRCGQGRYGKPEVVTEMGLIHESVKARYVKICKEKLETIRVITKPFQKNLAAAEIEKIDKIENKWRTLQSKKKYTEEEQIELVSYAVTLPATLDRNYENKIAQSAKLSKRIRTAQDKITKLIVKYRHR